MHPLSDELIEILQLVAQYGATRVDLTSERIRMFRGGEIIGDLDPPKGSVETIADDLRAMGARTASPVDLQVQSPVGPVRFTAQVTATITQLTFRASNDAKAEALFSEIMARLAALGGDRVSCSPMAAAYFRGSEKVDFNPSLDGRYEPLIEFGRKLGSIEGATGSGGAIVMSPSGAPRSLSIEVGVGVVTFTVK